MQSLRSKKDNTVSRPEHAGRKVAVGGAAAGGGDHMLAELRQDVLVAFAENPLPLLFKEKVAAYLARYCAVSFPLIFHSCGLYGLGMPAREIVLLLQEPDPEPAAITQHLA